MFTFYYINMIGAAERLAFGGLPGLAFERKQPRAADASGQPWGANRQVSTYPISRWS